MDCEDLSNTSVLQDWISFSIIHLLCSLTLTISTHCSNLGLKDGAISLDGGIIRGNDAVYLGCLFQQVKSSISMPLQVMNKRGKLNLKLFFVWPG